MKNKIETQMEIRVAWLQGDFNYSREDFKYDLIKYANTLNTAHYLEMISDNVYKQCKDLLQSYIKYVR